MPTTPWRSRTGSALASLPSPVEFQNTQSLLLSSTTTRPRTSSSLRCAFPPSLPSSSISSFSSSSSSSSKTCPHSSETNGACSSLHGASLCCRKCAATHVSPAPSADASARVVVRDQGDTCDLVLRAPVPAARRKYYYCLPKQKSTRNNIMISPTTTLSDRSGWMSAC